MIKIPQSKAQFGDIPIEHTLMIHQRWMLSWEDDFVTVPIRTHCCLQDHLQLIISHFNYNPVDPKQIPLASLYHMIGWDQLLTGVNLPAKKNY